MGLTEFCGCTVRSVANHHFHGISDVHETSWEEAMKAAMSASLKKSAMLLGSVGLPLIVSVSVAASSPTDLGPPMDIQSTAAYFPLSGFHRIPTTLKQHGKPEILFISAESDGASAAERWPLVKALDQFGSLSAVRESTTNPLYLGSAMAAYPTFDLSHAIYRSTYVVFVHKDLLTVEDRPYQSLDPIEQSLYARYARALKPFGKNDRNHVGGTLANANGKDTRRLPLIAVGGYLQTVSQVITEGDLLDQTGARGLPFDTVHSALVTGKAPFPGTNLVSDVNAEANIITALICHADGRWPAKVCGRPVIKTILKSVR